MDKNKVIAAAQMAVLADINNMTCDRIDALTGGHGMLNMSIYSVANVIADELLRGGDLSMKFANARHLPVEDIMKKAVDAAKAAGSDGANAALIAASIMYLCGTAAQVGIPAGNRKLGAMARLIAGVDRCGVAMMPTAKMNNKISGFPAVLAINQAMLEGKLTSYDGRSVPVNVGGGPLYGHSALGEDYIWPDMARNGARIGTQAMMDAMAGAAMVPHPFTCAIFGAAAILEIIHPDAEVPEDMGTYGRTSSAYLVGRTAAETAGLPEKLHMKVTGEEYETAKVVGDIGLLLKDIGGVSVIGMMAFDEIFSSFQEGIAGFSGAPLNAPLGHVGAYCVVALKALLKHEGDMATVAKLLADDRFNTTFDGETALICLNTVSRKSQELRNGPVSKVLVKATDPMRAKAIQRRTEAAYELLAAGETVEAVAGKFDDERKATVEQGASKMFSAMMGADIKITVKSMGPAARRTSKLAQKYWSFDPKVDVEMKMGADTFQLDGFAHDLVPKIVKGERPDLAPIAPLPSAVMCEFLLAACNIVNVIVPAAVAAAMKKVTPKEAGAQAEAGAYLTLGIPGGKAAATAVATTALEMIECMEG